MRASLGREKSSGSCSWAGPCHHTQALALSLQLLVESLATPLPHCDFLGGLDTVCPWLNSLQFRCQLSGIERWLLSTPLKRSHRALLS